MPRPVDPSALATLGTGARFPMPLLFAAIAVTLVAFGVFSADAWSHARELQSFEEGELAIERVCGRITLLDEVLTMSARMCAATGDLAWAERHHEHVPQLEAALAAARELAPEVEDLEGTSQTAAANERLVTMEQAAFELVRRGDADAAKALLASDEYTETKRTYAAGTKRYLQSMRTRVASIAADQRERSHRSFLFLATSLPTLLILWALLARSLRTHYRIRRDYEQRLRDYAVALERSTAEAQRAEHAKSEFLARMSHEIRTPMNGVLGVTGLLAETAMDGEQRDLVELVRRSGELLLSIIDDVLDVSKIEAGKLRISSCPADPRRIAEDVVQILNVKASEKGILLSGTVADDVPACVRVDAVRLRQVLMNLVGNAIKFTEAGTVELRLDLLDRDETTCTLRYEVRDTGVGIPTEQLETIWDSFEQADETIGQRFGGTGLGLTISRHLVELMGGRIDVESEDGGGTVFAVELVLPLATPDVEAALPSEHAATERSGARVLLAEDNRVNQVVAERLLVRAGCRVDVVEDGAACLAAAAREPYDLILMDCHMPRMSGLEATRAIRALTGDARRTPIVALTASVFPGDRDACRAAGMDDFLTKPIQLDQFGAMLARWLGVRDGSGPAAAV